MLQISTKGRYGVRLMIDLALRYGEGPVLLREIAGRQGISEKYLWNLISPLKNAGLVVSYRGARGGYSLAKPPSKINLGEIMRLLEGPLCLVGCVEKPSECGRSAMCIIRDVWEDVSRRISKTLESITLAEMVRKNRTKKTEVLSEGKN
ncbi:MAG TPA: Rrf2 family transcriptional regulator [Syntrophales bacterium]|nr:Rrf2 family transcriptional regulator [Syntrophales bacterium]